MKRHIQKILATAFIIGWGLLSLVACQTNQQYEKEPNLPSISDATIPADWVSKRGKITLEMGLGRGIEA